MKNKLGLLLPLALLLVLTGCSESNPKKHMVLGTWNEKTYVNEFAELTFTVPADWTICTAQDIENIFEDNIAKEMLPHYDAMVCSNTADSSLMIIYEDLTEISYINETEYLETIKKQFGRQKKQANSMEIHEPHYYYICEPRNSSEIAKAIIGERTYYVLSTEFNNLGAKQIYYARKVGETMVVLIFTTTGDDTLTDIFV